MRRLEASDTHRTVAGLPSALGRTMRDSETPVMVAGGYVRATIAGERAKDVDVFVPNEKAADDLLSRMAPGADPHVTEFARSVLVGGRLVQVIHRWDLSTPIDVMDQFDFTVCQAVVHHAGGEWRGVCSDLFYEDLASRRIRYTREPDDERPAIEAGGTLLRLVRYVARGYRASPETVAAVAYEAVRAVRDEGGESWTGGDQFYRLSLLTETLRGVDPVPTPEWMRAAEESGEVGGKSRAVSPPIMEGG